MSQIEEIGGMRGWAEHSSINQSLKYSGKVVQLTFTITQQHVNVINYNFINYTLEDHQSQYLK